MLNFGDVLARRARMSPHAEAVVELASEKRLSFADLDDSAIRCANFLLELGVNHGDRVAVLLKNRAECLQLFFACARIGAVFVPLNWRLVSDELQHLLEDSGAKVLISETLFADTLAPLLTAIPQLDRCVWVDGGSPEDGTDFQHACELASSLPAQYAGGDTDILMIMYTSGTTGLPKGSMHSHESMFWTLLTASASSDLRPGDRFFLAMPLFHMGALGPALINVYNGIASVIESEFDPQRCLETIQTERINMTLMVPAMLLMLQEGFESGRYDISTLRWILCGAAPVPEHLIRQYLALDIQIIQVYGLTESGGPGCMILPDEALGKIGSTGRPQFHTDVKVVDAQGKVCPAGEAGEILIAGKHVMVSYWNLPKATAEVMVDGWIRSGDIGVLDDEGYLTIVDRLKDMLISGGENVYPAELENVLLGLPGVSEAVVIGARSRKWGESPIAFVVRNDTQLNEEKLLEQCSDKLAPYKRIKRVYFVEGFPRNASGKVLKNELRERVSDLELE